MSDFKKEFNQRFEMFNLIHDANGGDMTSVMEEFAYDLYRENVSLKHENIAFREWAENKSKYGG